MEKKNVYVGNRYVPKIMEEWDNTIPYESLSVVTYQGGSYTSKKNVPIGVNIFNEEYWVMTGNYNAQVENYRQEMVRTKQEIDADLAQHKNEIDSSIDVVQNNINRLQLSVNSIFVNVLYPPENFDPAPVNNGVDATNYIQALLDYLNSKGGGTLFIPAGDYNIEGNLRVYSNTIVKGEGRATVLNKQSGGYVFMIQGSKYGEINTSLNLTSGDRRITTTIANNYNVGDILLITSQRNALSKDGGKAWQLGGATAGTSTAYYGEFLKVSSKLSENSVEVASGLIYPDYLINNTMETVKQKARTTVQKVAVVKDVLIKDLVIKGDTTGGVRMHNAYNCFTENIIFLMGLDATTIFINESFGCSDFKSRTYFDPNHIPSDHYKRNAYKSVSSQACGFVGSYCEYGTQPFDFTFNDGSIVTTFPYAEQVETHYSTQNSLTSHGGTYGTKVSDSKFLNCVNYGISSRSRGSVITDNVIQGSFSSTFSYGVAMYEGHAVDSIVSNNQISGFNKGVTIIDGADDNKFYEWVGLTISNNVFKDVNRVIIFERNSENKFQGDTGVLISNNIVSNFKGQYAKFVTTNGADGVLIANNIINDLNNLANAGVYVVNSDNIAMVDNLFNGLSLHLWVEEVTDGRNLNIKYVNRYRYSANAVRLPESNVTTSVQQFGNFHPRTDDELTLGWSGGRWKDIFASNGTINTSDRDMKQQIEAIPDEWLDAWEKVKYHRYKFNDAVDLKGDNARWHIGVVAQEIEEAFKSVGLDAREIGLLCYDEWEDEETKEPKKLWSIRPTECNFMETALLRRELERIKERV